MPETYDPHPTNPSDDAFKQTRASYLTTNRLSSLTLAEKKVFINELQQRLDAAPLPKPAVPQQRPRPDYSREF